MSSPGDILNANEPSPACLAPLGVDLASLVEEYAGPVAVVGADGEMLAANGRARSLLDENAHWWPEMADWRAKAAEPDALGEQSDYLISFERPSGTTVLAWQAVRLKGRGLLLLGRDATPEHRLRQRLQLASQHASTERQLRETLTESRQRYKDLVEISSDFAWETDSEGRFVFVSPAGALGWKAAQLVGRSPRETLAGDDDLPSPFETRRPVERLMLWMRAADGSSACLEVSAKPLLSPPGVWSGARGVCRNLTEQVTREAELARIRNREGVLNRVSSVLRDPLAPDEIFTLCAHEAVQALGATCCVFYALEEGSGGVAVVATCGEPLCDIVPILAQAQASAGPVAERLDEVGVLVCATRFQGAANGAVAVWRPAWSGDWDEDAFLLIGGIAERIAIAHAQIAYQRRLRHLSERDGLTGLFNRRALLERLDDALYNSENGPSALLYMDLDNFKVLNDQCGHMQGDAALAAVANVLRCSIRPGDIAGRMGGDEFVLWLARAGEAVALTVSQRLLEGMKALEPLSAPGRPLSLSIGVAIHQPGLHESLGALIERADTAMYAAKSSGKNRFSLAREHDPETPCL